MTKLEMLLASVTLATEVSYDNAYVQVTLGDQPENNEQSIIGFEQNSADQAVTRQAV